MYRAVLLHPSEPTDLRIVMQRQAWQALFRHDLFDSDGEQAAHLLLGARRVLAPFDADAARALRARIIQRLH